MRAPMPRYHVDLQSETGSVIASASFEAKDDNDARPQAIKALASLVRGRDDSLGHLRYIASVRDRRGITLFYLDLSLDFGPPS